MKRTMRWVGVCLLFSLAWGVAGMHAQQAVSAEPQAPSRMVPTPPELVPTLPIPRLVKVGGTLKDELGKARTGVVGVTFAIYKEREGGAALWMETQNVELDEQGRYTVLLGATKNEGLPLELFASGEPRWLAWQVQLPGEVEQPRVLLVSVPYALKAADADTLGGKPLSSFVLATPQSDRSPGASKAPNTAGGITAVAAAAIGGGGGPNVVAKFDATGANVINSSIFDNGTFVGIGTTNPDSNLHILGSGADVVFNFQNAGIGGHAFRFDSTNNNSGFGGGKLVMQDLNAAGAARFTIDSNGFIGLGTASPDSHLHIQASGPDVVFNFQNAGPGGHAFRFDSTNSNSGFGGGKLVMQDLNAGGAARFTIDPNGLVGIGTTAPGQKLSVAGVIESTTGGFKFPDGTVQTTAAAGGGGTGTVTSVAAGAGLNASPANPITSSGTFSIATGGVTNSMLAANSVTNANIADGGLSPAKITGAAATLGANSFVGNQSIAGNITAAAGNLSASSSGPTLGVTQGGTGNGLEVTANSSSTGTEAVRGQVVAQNTLSFNTIGVHGITNSGGGRGVLGEATSLTTTAIGVQGLSSSDAGIGVSGVASAGGSVVGVQGEATAGPVSGNTIGVRGVSASNFGTGVQGEATSTSGFGVGVHGLLFGTTGVAGLFSAGPNTTLILGQSSGINVFSVNSSGNVSATNYSDRVTGVNIGLATNCVTGQIMKWNGTTWNCNNDLTGITTITPGAGLTTTPNPITTSGTINIATGGVTNSMLSNSSITVNAGTGLTGGGAVTLGNSLSLSNTGVLSFNGRPGLVIPIAGDYSFSQIGGAATSAQLPAASLVRAITYLAGCDSCGLLTTADSQNTIFLNVIGSMTINSVTCFSDAGAPTVNIQRHQAGTLTNILSANLTCSTTGDTSSSFSTSALSLNDSLNFTMATADGVARRVTVIIKATVN